MSFYTIIGAIGTTALALYAFYAWRQMKRENIRFEKHIAAKMAVARMKERRRLLGLDQPKQKPAPQKTNNDLPEWWINSP
jgi:hypothetical protein